MSNRRDERERRLVEVVFGDDSAARPRERLDPAGQRELEQLTRLDALLAVHGRREPDPARRAHLWTRLEARLGEVRPRPRRRLIWATALVATAVAMVTAIVLLPQPASGPVVVAPATATVTPAVRLDHLLARSQPLLMAVANHPAGGPFDAERRLAADLAHESRAVAGDLDPRRHRRDRELAAELAAMMLQIANADQPADLELVRATLRERRLLLSISLRALRQTAVTAPGRKDLRDA